MNILHITPYYAPAWAFGGVVSAVAGLAEAQAARGHRVRVLTTDAQDLSGAGARSPIRCETLDGVEVERCPNLSHLLRARYNLSSPRGFRVALRRLAAGSTVIHTHELRTVENLLISMAPPKPMRNLPVILSPHGTLPYGTGRGIVKRAWDALLGRRLLRRIDYVAALTAAEADEARSLWAAQNVSFPGASVIPNGVSGTLLSALEALPKAAVTAFRQRYIPSARAGESLMVLFLGRLHQRKGLQYLIPAFARIAPEFPAACLLIAGPDAGMLQTARALAAQTGVAERVVFTGLLSGEDRLAALAAADIFALPAVGEGLSMAALEAMAGGVPLILTPGCNLPELEQRGAGLLVERAIEPLAGALRALLADQALRRTMGQQGRAWVQQSFTWAAAAARTETLYDDVVQRSRYSRSS